MYCVTQRLVARSRRTPAVLILPMLLGAFQPPKPAPSGPATVFPLGREPRTCRHLAMSGGYIYILGSHTGTLYIGLTSNLYLRVIPRPSSAYRSRSRSRASVVEKLRAAWVR
jgi:hypothetical protein